MVDRTSAGKAMTPAKLRWGLIGCGDIARKRVAPALRDHPSSELVAISRALRSG